MRTSLHRIRPGTRHDCCNGWLPRTRRC